MKRFFAIAFMAIMMCGTAVATENLTVSDNISVADAPNAFDKTIALIKSYTKKLRAAKSIEELETVAANFEKEAAAMEKVLSSETERLFETLSEEELENYGKAIESALEELFIAVEEKSAEFLDEADDYTY